MVNQDQAGQSKVMRAQTGCQSMVIIKFFYHLNKERGGTKQVMLLVSVMMMMITSFHQMFRKIF